MEKSLNEGRFSGKGQDKLDVVILHFPNENLLFGMIFIIFADSLTNIILFRG